MVQVGEHELLKASTHAGLFALAVVCVGYNAWAFAVRREAHLARNVVIYGGLAVWELMLTKHHLQEGPSA